MSASERTRGDSLVQGRLRRVGNLPAVAAPTGILADRGAARLRARIGAVKFRAYVYRLPDMAVVVVPLEVCAAAGVRTGDPVSLWIEAERPDHPMAVPADVSDSLTSARADITTLTTRERRQSLWLIREAASPAIRASRIEALTAAYAAETAEADRQDQSS